MFWGATNMYPLTCYYFKFAFTSHFLLNRPNMSFYREVINKWMEKKHTSLVIAKAYRSLCPLAKVSFLLESGASQRRRKHPDVKRSSVMNRSKEATIDHPHTESEVTHRRAETGSSSAVLASGPTEGTQCQKAASRSEPQCRLSLNTPGIGSCFTKKRRWRHESDTEAVIIHSLRWGKKWHGICSETAQA